MTKILKFFKNPKIIGLVLLVGGIFYMFFRSKKPQVNADSIAAFNKTLEDKRLELIAKGVDVSGLGHHNPALLHADVEIVSQKLPGSTYVPAESRVLNLISQQPETILQPAAAESPDIINNYYDVAAAAVLPVYDRTIVTADKRNLMARYLTAPTNGMASEGINI